MYEDRTEVDNHLLEGLVEATKEIEAVIEEVDDGINVIRTNAIVQPLVEGIQNIQPIDIKILRLKAGIDQRALAQAASMSNNTISRLENGLTSLTGLPFDKVVSLLNVLNVNDNVYKYLREGEMN